MWFRKNAQKISYDRNLKKAVIKSSICSGERVAGFNNLQTGKFEDVMLIRKDKDLDKFMKLYNISVEEITKEW